MAGHHFSSNHDVLRHREGGKQSAALKEDAEASLGVPAFFRIKGRDVAAEDFDVTGLVRN